MLHTHCGARAADGLRVQPPAAPDLNYYWLVRKPGKLGVHVIGREGGREGAHIMYEMWCTVHPV